MLRIGALEQTVAESARKVQLGVQVEIDVFAEIAESFLGNDATSERIVELEAELATKEWRSHLTVGQKTPHTYGGLPKAVAPKQTATAQDMRYRQHAKGRATVHYVESAFAHRTVDKGRVAFSGAQAHLDDGGAEVRRGARHGQAGAENENSTDGLSMPLELLLKGLDVSHVDIALRLPSG
jgi:hypothetical protein